MWISVWAMKIEYQDGGLEKLLKIFFSYSLHWTTPAITEVIKQQGGKESDTEYFGALMTTLEVAEASEDSLGAAVCLLGMVIKRVPSSVLKIKFSSSAKTLLELLARHIESDNSVLVRSLIGCLGVLLRHQDAGVWTSSSTLQIYDALLTFVTNPKAKVRKAAQHTICAILKASLLLTDSAEPPLLHPVAAHTGKFCVQQIDEHGFTGGDSSPLLHLLHLLKDIFGVFPQVGFSSPPNIYFCLFLHCFYRFLWRNWELRREIVANASFDVSTTCITGWRAGRGEDTIGGAAEADDAQERAGDVVRHAELPRAVAVAAWVGDAVGRPERAPHHGSLRLPAVAERHATAGRLAQRHDGGAPQSRPARAAPLRRPLAALLRRGHPVVAQRPARNHPRRNAVPDQVAGPVPGTGPDCRCLRQDPGGKGTETQQRCWMGICLSSL